MPEDKYLNFLTEYFKKHGTINDISRDLVVDYEGEQLKIGEFLGSIRRQHKLYKNGKNDRACTSKTATARYQVLDSLLFEWEPGAKKQIELEENDIVLNYILKYYNKHSTLENIPETAEVNGEIISIKNFFNRIRTGHKKYLAGKNQKGSGSPTSLRRYAVLDSINFEWEPKLRKDRATEEDDKYIRFLKEYYKINKSLQDVPNKVIFENEELNIIGFLSDRRKKRKKLDITPTYKPSKLELKRWQELDEMQYDWNQHEHRIENDKFIRYLKKHFQEYGTINNIKAKQEIEFEGKTLKIGVFVHDCRKKYWAYTTGKDDVNATTTPLMLKRYAELEAMNIDWRPSESVQPVAKIARENNLKARTLKKYIDKFDGDTEKAVKVCTAMQQHKSKKTAHSKIFSPNIQTIIQEFEIDIDTFISLLNRTSLRTKQPSPTLMYDEKTNLRQFCIDNGLNYTVIQKAVKLKMNKLCNEDLESLINRCIVEYKTNGQKRPATWIYSKYGNELLVSHLLTSLNLDAEAVLRDMSKNCITLDEAIENNSFQRSSKQNYDYLAPLYHNLIDFYKTINNTTAYTPETAPTAIVSYFENLITEYKLNSDEFKVLQTSFTRYVEAIEQYKLFNVGFEKDPKKRVEKIIAYNLDEDEIEEAFFLPLKFDKKALIGRDSELYKRRVLLKNLTVGWNTLPENEQKSKISKYALTIEEIRYITETRQLIDETKEKVKLKK